MGMGVPGRKQESRVGPALRWDLGDGGAVGEAVAAASVRAAACSVVGRGSIARQKRLSLGGILEGTPAVNEEVGVFLVFVDEQQ